MKYEWKENKTGDDLTCKIGKLTLRVEQMGRGRWWYQVYCGGEEFFDEHNFDKTKKKAIERCEVCADFIISAIRLMGL